MSIVALILWLLFAFSPSTMPSKQRTWNPCYPSSISESDRGRRPNYNSSEWTDIEIRNANSIQNSSQFHIIKCGMFGCSKKFLCKTMPNHVTKHHELSVKANESIVYMELTATDGWKSTSFEYQDRKQQIENKKKQQQKKQNMKRKRDSMWSKWSLGGSAKVCDEIQIDILILSLLTVRCCVFIEYLFIECVFMLYVFGNDVYPIFVYEVNGKYHSLYLCLVVL